jgi:nucleotide-binding universal stress UspA family protein
MIRILVPISLSTYELNAIHYAITLGQKLPTEITLAHCFPKLIEDPSVASETDIKSRQHFVAIKKEQERRTLEELAENTRASLTAEQTKNVLIKTQFVEGYPEDALIQLSQEMNPDCIVMGTQSKGETIKELLGSITSDVMKKAKVPVLAIPAKSMVNLDRISHILFITDFGETDYRSLHKLIRLITPFKTVIYCMHFCTSPPDKWDKQKLNEFKMYCETTYRNHAIEAENIHGENFIDTLEHFISDKNIDLIAMTRKRRNMITAILHPSISRKILFHTDIPLLVFHE